MSIQRNQNASSIKYTTLQSTVDSAVTAGKKSVSISFYTTCATATTASFMTYHDGMLWVGLFTDKGDPSGMMYSYTIGSGASKLTKKYNITLPDRIQGACFKDGYLILSRSYSRNVSSSSHISQLRIYKYSAPDSSGNIKKNSVVKVIDLPPMVEGIVAGSTYMYLLFESAATKYYKGTDGSGTCKYPTDRYVAFKFADFLEQSGSSTTTPGEAGYFPACDPNESSIANALSSLGYDSSFANRKVIAAANGITDYTGTAEQNIQLLDLMKAGKLIDPNGGSTGGGTTDEGDTPGGDSTEEETIAPATVELDFYSTMLLAGESAQIKATFTEGSVTGAPAIPLWRQSALWMRILPASRPSVRVRRSSPAI